MRYSFRPKFRREKENFNCTYYLELKSTTHINLALVPHNTANPKKQKQYFPDSGSLCLVRYKERKESDWFKIGLLSD